MINWISYRKSDHVSFEDLGGNYNEVNLKKYKKGIDSHLITDIIVKEKIGEGNFGKKSSVIFLANNNDSWSVLWYMEHSNSSSFKKIEITGTYQRIYKRS